MADRTHDTIGIIDFNRLVEMLSGPELFLFFDLLRASFIISGSYLQKQSFYHFFLRANQRIFSLSLGYSLLVEDS